MNITVLRVWSSLPIAKYERAVLVLWRWAQHRRACSFTARIMNIPGGWLGPRIWLHARIGPDADPARSRRVRRTGQGGRHKLRLRTDSEAARVACVRAGLGIGVMQAGIAVRDPMLEPVLPDVVGLTLDTWLALHDDLRRMPKIRLVADHLSAVLPTLLYTGEVTA